MFRYLYFSLSIIDSQCSLGTQEWRCSSKYNKFIVCGSLCLFLGSQKCGNKYGSCIGDPPKPLETHVVVIISIAAFILTVIVSVCAFYCRRQQRNQAIAELVRQRQAMATQNQARYIYYITSVPSFAAQPPIQETAPPSYEQITRKTVDN
jgi:hypothetical protein